jgi:hypothetical protein
MRVVVSLSTLIIASTFALAQQQQPPAAQAAPIPEAPPPQEPAPTPPPPQHVALRIVGSHVRNATGEKLGRIEEVLVNRTSGVIDYAVLAPNFPTNEARLVPVPWSILTYAWDQSRAGGPAGANQIFIANVDSARLARAPVLDRTRTTGIDPALAAANNYFGVPVGATGAGSESVVGTAAGQPAVVSQPGTTSALPEQQVETGTLPNQNATVSGATNPSVRVPHQPTPGQSSAPRGAGPNDNLGQGDPSVTRPGGGPSVPPPRAQPGPQRPSGGAPPRPSAPAGGGAAPPAAPGR